MNFYAKKAVLMGSVMLLTACAYNPNQYGSYPSDGSYYPNSGYYQGYGNSENYRQYSRPPQPAGNWKQGGRNNQNNYYNRSQPRSGASSDFQNKRNHDNRNYQRWHNRQRGNRYEDDDD